jgi:DNA mismatch repair protein MutS2
LSEILKSCNEKTLVLIDELAGSTEPKEGEALGQAIIKEMLRKGAKFILTTHYQQLKEMPYSDKRLANAFVEFDEETLTRIRPAHGGAGAVLRSPDSQSFASTTTT